MRSYPRPWMYRGLPLLLLLCFGTLPLVFAVMSAAFALAYAVAVIAFVAGLTIGERSVRLEEIERRDRAETRRLLREQLAREAAATRDPPLRLPTEAADPADANTDMPVARPRADA